MIKQKITRITRKQWEEFSNADYTRARNLLIPMAEKKTLDVVGPKPTIGPRESQKAYSVRLQAWGARFNHLFMGNMDSLAFQAGLIRPHGELSTQERKRGAK